MLHSDQNHAKHSGGGIYAKNSRVNLYASTIATNIANMYDGGGIFAMSNSDISVRKISLLQNIARYAGGGIFFKTSVAVINDTTIRGNNAIIYDGGGLYANENAVIKLIYSEFLNNVAGRLAMTRFTSSNTALVSVNVLYNNMSQNDFIGQNLPSCSMSRNLCSEFRLIGICEDDHFNVARVGIWCKTQCYPHSYHIGNDVTALKKQSRPRF